MGVVDNKDKIKEQRYTILNFLYNKFFYETTEWIHTDEIYKLLPDVAEPVIQGNLLHLYRYGYIKGKEDENKKDNRLWFVKISKEGTDHIESI